MHPTTRLSSSDQLVFHSDPLLPVHHTYSTETFHINSTYLLILPLVLLMSRSGHSFTNHQMPSSRLPLNHGVDTNSYSQYDTIDDLHWKTDRQAASLI